MRGQATTSATYRTCRCTHSDNTVLTRGYVITDNILVQRSVIQLAENGHPSVGPVALGLVRGQGDGQHVVGRVACGGQRASPGTRLVHWSDVGGAVFELVYAARLQPDLWAEAGNAGMDIVKYG